MDGKNGNRPTHEAQKNFFDPATRNQKWENTQDAKIKFFIEIQMRLQLQNTEFTALTHSFDYWNTKFGSWLTLPNLRNTNENRRSGHQPQSPWVLFIGLTKRLKFPWGLIQ
jgi:hypothetical protein